MAKLIRVHGTEAAVNGFVAGVQYVNDSTVEVVTERTAGGWAVLIDWDRGDATARYSEDGTLQIEDPGEDIHLL